MGFQSSIGAEAALDDVLKIINDEMQHISTPETKDVLERIVAKINSLKEAAKAGYA